MTVVYNIRFEKINNRRNGLKGFIEVVLYSRNGLANPIYLTRNVLEILK